MARLNKKLILLLALILVVLLALFLYTTRISVANLPEPQSICSMPLTWKGLIPGVSTQQDVMNTLGEPFDKGKIRSYDRSINYYAYKFSEGKISNYVLDRIFFRADGTIDWMEIIEADRNGGFPTVFDTSSQLDNALDIVYVNNNFDPNSNFIDVLSGPDQIYVWSSCGLALDVISREFSSSFQADKLNCLEDGYPLEIKGCNLDPKFKSLSNVGNNFIPDADDIVLMKFYFEPTTYDAFNEYYREKIPYGIFDKYLADISN